jgi:signal transduction histidine kinase/ActR/RegA family two-component response regulator
MGNTLEAVVGAAMVQRLAGGTRAFEHARNTLRFILYAGFLSTALCATIGTTSLALNGLAAWNYYLPIWMTWWLGDVVSNLVLAPLLLVWCSWTMVRTRRLGIVEWGFLLVATAVVSELVFGNLLPAHHVHYPLEYMVIPLLLWAAFRFRQHGVTLVGFVIGAIAVHGTLRGFGPFGTADPNESFLLLQTFIAIISITMLIITAILSERTRTAELLNAARSEAESANRAKDQFLAVLSHELRTPLTPVMLALSLFERDPKLPAHLADEVQMMRRNVELEARLIDDLLDLTRIGKGRLKLSVEDVDLHPILEHVREICRQPDRPAVRFDLRAEQHWLRGDPARLEQIFWNLLTNACKFTPADGSVTVRTANDGKGIVIDVVDTGMGIEPELMGRLFKPFEQGDQTGATARGLGLGLAICKSLCDAHGGRLNALSEGRGRGATFRVELPVSAAPATAAPARAPMVAGEARPLRILIVEDHPATRELLDRLLARLGHAAQSAGDIASALRALEVGTFDLMISDLGLPDGYGTSLMQTVARQYGLKGIAISGYGMERDIQLSHEAGFADHLTKPVDFQKLREAIARVAGGERDAVASVTSSSASDI